VLANLCLRAQAYNRFIEPVVSLMIDFYVRVFVRVGSSGAETQLNVTKIGHVWQCPSCHYFETQTRAYKHPTNNKFIVNSGTPVPPECPHCQSRFKMAGPLWLGPLHQADALGELSAIVESKGEQFASQKKLTGLLSVAASELPDVPLFYNLSDLCNVLHSTSPSMHAFKSAIINAGYRVSGFHTEPYAFKTDAPMNIIFDILRCWKRKTGLGKKLSERTPAYRILQKEPEHEADFTLVDEAATNKKRPRFIKVDGWGPKTKAVTGSSHASKKKTKLNLDEDSDHEGDNGEPRKEDAPAAKKTKTEQVVEKKD